MKACTLFSSVATVALVVAGSPHPAQAPFHDQSLYSSSPIIPVSFGAPNERWRFDIGPSPNGTANYVFESVASLLQQWPNTRYRNGHNLVPVTIPVGTLLHHGTDRNQTPSVPEWVATDPEHAYLFCRFLEKNTGCWQLTVTVTRPLNVLYFDGSSAAKVLGALDMQDILVWGEVQPERIFDEENRIQDLCRWGKKYNIDGFMRMEMNFEIMLCDFTAGVEVSTFLNLRTEFPAWPPPEPRFKVQDIDGLLPRSINFAALRVFQSGQWHNRFPGETRAKLDLTRLVSLYDTDLFPSLVDVRHGQERWDHRVEKISKEDRQTLLHRLDEVWAGSPSREVGSGVDWTSLIRIIIHRYADHLEALQYLLNATQSRSFAEEDAQKTIDEVHEYIASLLNPYILNAVRPNTTSLNLDSPPLTWATPVFETCATAHTRVISTSLYPLLTQSERFLLNAVESVSHEICRIITSIWADGVELGLEGTKVRTTRAHLQLDTVLADWGSRIDGLIRWLDWSVWVKCKPGCSIEEMCYLPTWPCLRIGGGLEFCPIFQPPQPGVNHEDGNGILGEAHPSYPWLKRDRVWGWVKDFGMVDDEDDYSHRPQPSCIRRMVPLQGL